jgi:hypothetical protein
VALTEEACMAKAKSSRFRRLASCNCPHNHILASVAKHIISNGQTAEGLLLAARQGLPTLRVDDLMQGIPHRSGSVWHGLIAHKRHQQLHLMLWHPHDRACGEAAIFQHPSAAGKTVIVDLLPLISHQQGSGTITLARPQAGRPMSCSRSG